MSARRRQAVARRTARKAYFATIRAFRIPRVRVWGVPFAACWQWHQWTPRGLA